MKSAAKWFLLAVLSALLLGAVPGSLSAQCSCQSTGFVDPETNTPLNACIVNPTSTVTGILNASPCNIAVYFNSGQGQVGDGQGVLNTDISGATHYGVLVDGSVNDVAVDVLNATIHNIGNLNSPNSNQGVCVSYRAYQTNGNTGTAGGTVSNSTVYAYQKGGIETNGQGVNATIRNSTVTGSGPGTPLAQNGIQVGFGANVAVTGNTVASNSFTNDLSFAATGVLLVGGPYYNGSSACPGATSTNPCPYTVATQVLRNTMSANDVGAYLYNTPDGVSQPATATNNAVLNNTMSIAACSNSYMTGATDFGNSDNITNNTTTGYTSAGGNTCLAVDNGGHTVYVSPHK